MLVVYIEIPLYNHLSAHIYRHIWNFILVESYMQPTLHVGNASCIDFTSRGRSHRPTYTRAHANLILYTCYVHCTYSNECFQLEFQLKHNTHIQSLRPLPFHTKFNISHCSTLWIHWCHVLRMIDENELKLVSSGTVILSENRNISNT